MQKKKRGGSHRPAHRNPCGFVSSLVSSVSFVAAARIAPSATSRSAPTPVAPTAAATASRRSALAIAVAAVHRTIRCRLKRKLVDRLPAVGALQTEMAYVDHPTFSEAHSISFCDPVHQTRTAQGGVRVDQRYLNQHEKEKAHHRRARTGSTLPLRAETPPSHTLPGLALLQPGSLQESRPFGSLKRLLRVRPGVRLPARR